MRIDDDRGGVLRTLPRANEERCFSELPVTLSSALL
jgi:hypothetical protein